MKSSIRLFASLIGLIFYNFLFAQTTYYSFASGNWEDDTAWTLTSDGSSGAVGGGNFPGRADNVVIRSGHTITINNTADNGSTGVSPDGLGLANVGPFLGSTNATFYQTGDVIIANGGTLTSSVRVMLSGVLTVEDGGSFTMTGDLYFLGALTVAAIATFDIGDDLVFTGNSVAIINNTSTANDDLYIDHTDAQLCGNGAATLGSIVEYYNSGTAAQICSSFTINCGGTCATGPSGGFITGNTGPGGVGMGTSNLSLWLDANEITGVSNGADLTQWDDISGNGYNALVTANAPSYATTGGGNGFPTVNFDNANNEYMYVTGNGDIMPANDLSVFLVGIFQSTSDTRGAIISTNDDDNRDDGWGIMRDDATADVGFYVNNYASNNGKRAINFNRNHVWGIVYDDGNAQGSGHKSENNVSFNTSGTINYNGGANTDLLIGATSNNGGPNYFMNGNVSEVIVFDVAINEAQRVILTNYLSSKYNISLTSNDVYSMDTGANGEYDFEVAGVGQASDGSNHIDARGQGIVRVWNLSDLDNNEFLMWGHDDVPLTETQSGDTDGTIIEERLSRIWRIGETGDVGTVSISLDFSSIAANPLGSNLRLLIDRDGDGFADNDVTPIVGSESNDVVTFSNINFQDGDRFTLGNTNASIPLPIELIEFTAEPRLNSVALYWRTATEQNNDFFAIERSIGGKDWETITQVDGAGNSAKELSYQAFDNQPVMGTAYYRLKQQDFDGTTAYSPIERVDWQPIQTGNYATPNPSKGVFYLRSEEEVEQGNYILLDSSGKSLNGLIKSGPSGVSVDLTGKPDGVYLLKFNGIGFPSIKLIKK